ncbi:hypothetical protein LMG23992_04018 [Cupriavidus laharis]|uniref:Uncharacterized protein n=1 Tax=Cupriavidus laharis TaxID=151654 RepID=A0ABM8XHG1_9BURK|nr:DUF2188 domain-containing protein [Cupriavidus laharis]CAG9179610.1 hypothetical protein LMG23992_04018 [Cupriavidus laharis]
MLVTEVRVILTEESRWAVETDDLSRTRVIYPSRGAAIAAGVHMAIAEDAVLMIHGIEIEPKKSRHFSTQ